MPACSPGNVEVYNVSKEYYLGNHTGVLEEQITHIKMVEGDITILKISVPNMDIKLDMKILSDIISRVLLRCVRRCIFPF